MLLSSVNFVAKPKSGKGKDKKATDKKIVEEKQTTTTECEMCRKEREEENTIFQFPTPSYSSNSSFKSSGYVSEESLDSLHNIGDRVTIATGDDLCLSVDQFYYTIGLRDESRSDSTCVFRKRVLESKQSGGGHVETVVFVLDCDQDFYLTANKRKELELNFFGSSPNPEVHDERMFLVHHTTLGHALIQPIFHKNAYLHHIDQALSVQQLDLNWRCPEEYFFHFNAVPEPLSRRKSDKPKVCTHVQKVSDNTDGESTQGKSEKDSSENESSNSDSSKILLPTRKVCKNKYSIKNLFVGCFSGRGQLVSQSE